MNTDTELRSGTHLMAVQIVFSAVAVACALVAVGSWLLLDLGGVSAQDGTGTSTALTMYACTAAFVALLVGAAYVRERTSGARAVAYRAAYTMGLCGLPVLVLFVVLSRGAILEIGIYDMMIVALAVAVVVFRRRRSAE